MATAKRIIPCLDVDKGRVVKGVKFQDLKDAGDPVELAARYEEEGTDEIVLLDITASVEDRPTLYRVVKDTASVLTIPLTVGGGVRSITDFGKLLDSGADKVSINTWAVKTPSLVEEAAKEYGSPTVVVAIDAKRETSFGWRVYIKGGREPTSLEAVKWAKRVEELGAGEILLTSIDRDGTRRGYDLDLIRAVTNAVRIPVIASGGAGHPKHFLEAFKAGADAALAAGIFHYRVYSIRDVKLFLKRNGVEVRL